MGKELVTVTLCRENSEESWGFRLSGGRGTGQPLTISQVAKDSLAAKVGLSAHDFLVSIADKEVVNMSHVEAEKAVQDAGNRFQMVIQRMDFKKYEKTPADLSASKTLEPKDMNKTYNRKDWNCPWVRKDGRGLKQAIRAVDEVMTPAKTSIQHYYSEPKSILANEPMLSPEELQQIIREHGAESRPSSSAQITGGQAMYQSEMEAEIQEEMMQRETRNTMDTRVHQEEAYRSSMAQNMESNNNYYSEREVDSQAPPDLEPVTPVPAAMVGEQGCYEPSADELIDVLKNLENLAAANPALYKSIVSQIKATTALGADTSHYAEESYETEENGSTEYNEQAYYEQQQQQQYYQNEEHMTNGSSSQFTQQDEYQQQMQYEQECARYEQEMYSQQTEQQVYQEERYESQQQTQSQQEVVMQEKYANETEEERNMRIKMERLEKEAQEEVRVALQKQREQKMAKRMQLEAQKPKEITVIAGDGKAVKIMLGADNKDNEDNRKQVAEAAGLKHIPLPDFDDSNSAWAGSLKKTDRSLHQKDKGEAGSPWAGSLRHVQERPRKAPKKDDDEDMYGTAPWMGTLRHVVHDNKVTRNFGVNQFQSKRYPDEDATNPFQATGGLNARPAFPLTPAAIINGNALSRSEMAMKEDQAEVDRIRGHIKSETVSSALLKALMPKLLKVHESKYQALDRDEASKIMEEILAMQVGLNVDQQADANEEAEMIIRAIMQDEVGKHIYAKMADDLEAAAQSRKIKEGKKKLKKVKAKKSAPSTVQSAA